MPAKQEKSAGKLSTRNRDNVYLYNQGRLNVVFAVSSVILIGAWIWMIAADYVRPWKGYQGRYYDKVVELNRDRTADMRRQMAELKVPYQAAQQQVDAAWRALNAQPRYQELKAATGGLRQLRDDADTEVKETKGLLDPARFQFEQAKAKHEAALRTDGRGARIAAGLAAERELPEAESALAAAGPDSGPNPDARGAAEARVQELRVAMAEAEAARAEVAGEAARMEGLRTALNQLADRLYRAQQENRKRAADYQDAADEKEALEGPWSEAKRKVASLREPLTKIESTLDGLELLYDRNQWRNAPFVDFIAPSIKVRQVVLDEIHDNWNFATNKKVDRCTTCHVGIDFPDFGDPEIIERYGIEPYMQSHPGLDLVAGPSSPHKVERMGCTVCHHGVGWSTDFARAAHTPADGGQKAEWQDEHDWYKAKYIDFPMQPGDYVQGQCFKCHKAGMFYPVAYEERLDHGYIQGKDEVGREKGQRLYAEDHPLFDAPENRLLRPDEVFDLFRLPDAPAPVAGDEIAVADATRAALKEHFEDNYDPDMVKGYDWRAKSYEKGYDTVSEYGCMGCHKIADFGLQVGYEQPPRVGPDLTYVAEKVKPDWLDRWIRHPDMYRPDTKMPSFYYFAHKDAQWEYVLDKDGKRQAISVLDAHRLSPKLEEAIGPISTPADDARVNVEIRAMRAYLLNQRNPRTGEHWSRANAEDPHFNAVYLVEPPAGDLERGRQLVNDLGCIACHIVPEVEVREGAEKSWQKDGPARFGHDPLEMRGPRLQSLGSKLKDRRWLNAWLADPRHYTAHTRMPDMRIVDVADLEGNVTLTAEQQRADIIDYLLSFEDEEFDALEETPFLESYEPILFDMYEYFFGKDAAGNLRRTRAMEADVGDLGDKQRLGTVLSMVGERLMGRAGCFGCHSVAGHENDQAIGTELTREGIKDLHQLDFGMVDKKLIPHSRHDFIRHKVTHPRIYDAGKVKYWPDKLRMPRFNFRMDDPGDGALPADEDADPIIPTRAAVTGMVLGLVEEPLQSSVLFDPDTYESDIIAGRRVVKRYGCNSCHTVEGKQGLLWAWRFDQAPDTGDLPPNLFSQGTRTRSEWLLKFLKDPFFLRPIVNIHMPRFGLTDEEATVLVKYFIRLGGRDRRLITPQPDSGLSGPGYGLDGIKPFCEFQQHEVGPIRDPIHEARLLFDTINCNKCHLPKGSPGADPTDGGVAPSFSYAKERLGQAWVRMLLNDPKHLINGTKMPQAYATTVDFGRLCEKKYQVYQFHLRDDPDWLALWSSDDPAKKAVAEKQLAEVQMDALTDYILHHYTAPGEER